jgi:ADP-heptose:LPS heptosyltransferase
MDASRLAVRPVVATAVRPVDVHVAQLLVDSVGAGCACDARPLNITALRSDEVLVHPGSGSARKNWPAKNVAAVIRQLDQPVRLIVGEADKDPAQAVEALVGRALPRLIQPGLTELARRLTGCRAYLGSDSGVSHLAGLCGARSVVMFGPTPAAVWRPIGPRVTVLGFESPPETVAAALTTD